MSRVKLKVVSIMLREEKMQQLGSLSGFGRRSLTE
jgi:hypothetical protein